MSRAALIAGVFALLTHCDAGVGTQVLVTFDADEATKERAAMVRLRVERMGLDPVVVTHALGSGEALTFPFIQSVSPIGGDATRGFRVRGELLDGAGTVFSVQEVNGTYSDGVRGEVRVRFDATCEDVLCGEGARCVDGSCRPSCVNPVPAPEERPITPPALCASSSKTLSFTYDGSGALTDFPLLVQLSDDDLRDLANAEGTDIGFSTPDGSLLDHEVEAYDAASGTLSAWVRLPSITPGTIEVEMHFGGEPLPPNPAGLWDAYAGVWHMAENDVGLPDSTRFGTTGAITEGASGEGLIGRAFYPDASAQSIRWGDPPDGHLDFANGESFTLSAWVWVNAVAAEGSGYTVIEKGASNGANPGYRITQAFIGGDVYRFLFGTDGTDAVRSFADDPPTGEWTHLVATLDFETSTMTSYRNGAPVGRASGADVDDIDADAGPDGNTRPLVAGPLDGRIDEVRIRRRAVSPAWVALEYRNQSSPGTFLTIGSLVENGP